MIGAALDLKDTSGAPLVGVKIKVKLALVSDVPEDTMSRVDAAISRLDNSLFSKISEEIDASATVAMGTYPAVEMVSSCIPPLGQAFEAIVKIARTSSDVCLSHLFIALSLTPFVSQSHPILKVACTVIFSVYEVSSTLL